MLKKKGFLIHFNDVSSLIKKPWSDSESLSMYIDATDVFREIAGPMERDLPLGKI